MANEKRALYVDTEVMFQDLELRRAGFSLLRSRLVTDRSVRLLVSDVVLLEATNHYRKFVEKSLVAYEKAARDLKTWLPRADISASYDKSVAIQEAAEYARRVRRTLESFEATIVPMSNVSHRKLVERAIERRKPFDENGRGFNDVMIWLSLVDYLRTKEFDEVILITNNIKDFASSGLVLDDLARDLHEASVVTRIRHCTGIHDALRILFGVKSPPVDDLERDKEWQRTLVTDHLRNIVEAIDDAICDNLLQVTELGNKFEIVAAESALVASNTASLALVVRFRDVVLTKLRSTARWDIFTTHLCNLDCRLEVLVDYKSKELQEPLGVDLVFVDRFGPAMSESRERIEE